MNRQFIKVSDAVIRDLSLRQLGLYALLALWLSAPGHEPANGGEQAALMHRCLEGKRAFCAAWKGLYQAGYLKQIRYPFSHNHLPCRYELRTVPDATVPAHRIMTALAIRSYLAALGNTPAYIPPPRGWTAAAAVILTNPAISLAAKGLYLRLLVSLPSGGAVNKASWRRKGQWNENAWRELLAHRIIDPQPGRCGGRFVCTYVIHDGLERTLQPVLALTVHRKLHRTGKEQRLLTAKERRMEEIRRQLDEPRLRRWANVLQSDGNWYTSEELEQWTTWACELPATVGMVTGDLLVTVGQRLRAYLGNVHNKAAYFRAALRREMTADPAISLRC